MQNLLDVTGAIRHSLNSTARDLEYLAQSFSVTGNSVTAERLYTLATLIQNDAAALNDAIDVHFDEYMAETAQSSHNVIMAALAGIGAGAKQND